MAIDFIPITLSAPQAPVLKGAILSLRQAQEQLQRVLDMMTNMEDGTTFTLIETQFGVPSGAGQQVFNLVNGTVGVMKGTFQNTDALIITQQVG